MENILICDFTGLPLQQEEISALISTSVLYMRQKQSGPVHFKHDYIDGEIEAHGRVSNGPVYGERFTVEYEWAGKTREVEFILPPIAQKIRVRKECVVFHAPNRGARPKRTVH